MKVGDKVTYEPPYYFDGEPVSGWPHKIGTVKRIYSLSGLLFAEVLYEGKEVSHHLIDDWYLIEEI